MNKDNKKIITLSEYDPKLPHRVVYPGLNLEGVCRNQKCKVFENFVWVRKDYGNFDIGYETDNSKCPICAV
jgi:hypothetical protein